MESLYISRKGEVRTKAYWLAWGRAVFKSANNGLRAVNKHAEVVPINIWERTTKVLQLTPYGEYE